MNKKTFMMALCMVGHSGYAVERIKPDDELPQKTWPNELMFPPIPPVFLPMPPAIPQVDGGAEPRNREVIVPNPREEVEQWKKKVGNEYLKAYQNAVKKDLYPPQADEGGGRFQLNQNANDEAAVARVVSQIMSVDIEDLSKDAQNYLIKSLIDEWGLIKKAIGAQNDPEDEHGAKLIQPIAQPEEDGEIRQAIALSRAEQLRSQEQAAYKQEAYKQAIVKSKEDEEIRQAMALSQAERLRRKEQEDVENAIAASLYDY